MSDSIFFSYSRYDSAFALRLANDLRNAGATIWLDQLDIPPGKHWDSEIEDALNNSNCLLAILSPKSMLSNNAMDEISYALEENKKVIPVLLTDTETPFRLRRLQRVDFTGDYDIAFRQLLSAIDIEKSHGAKPVFTNQDNLHPPHPTTNIELNEQKAPDQKEERQLAEPGSITHVTTNQNQLKKTSPPTSNFHGINKKNIVFITGLVVLSFIGWAAFIISGKPGGKKATADTAEQSVQKMIKSNDTLKHEIKDTISDEPAFEKLAKENIKSTETKYISAAKVETPKERTIKPQQKEKKIEISQDETETIKQITKPDSIPVILKNDEVKTEAQSKPPLPDLTVEKTVFLDSDIKFDVKLMESPDMKTRRVEQPVKFSVTRDVVLDGITIIREGAIVNGRMTVGLKFIGLRIDQVVGVNGKFIPLRSKESDLKHKEIKKDNTYIAIIKKGTKLVY